MITARANIVTLVLVAALLILGTMAGEPMAERLEHGCSPARTMPPVLSRLRRAISALMTACRTALGIDATFCLVALRPAAVPQHAPDERPLSQLRI